MRTLHTLVQTAAYPLAADPVQATVTSAQQQRWVALHGQQVCGHLIIQVAPDVGDVITLYVVPEARRQGIAQQLLRTALAALQRDVFLDVRASNLAAQALYTKLGAVQVGRRPRYYPDTSQTGAEDGIILQLSPRFVTESPCP